MKTDVNVERRRWGLTAVLLSFLLSLLPFTIVAADFEITRWEYAKPIFLPSDLGEESLVELALDQLTFSNAALGLLDLRILKEDGTEVPYNLEIERGSRERKTVSAVILDLAQGPGDYTFFVLDMNLGDLLHNELAVLTSSRNFLREVRLEGSSDAKTWSILREKGQIVDFTDLERGFNIRETKIVYPRSTVRYLRVRIQNNGETPLQVTGANVAFLEEASPQIVDYASTLQKQEENTKEKATMLTIDMGSNGVPTSRLTISTEQLNFYRDTLLESSQDGKKWTRIAEGALYSYNTLTFVGRQQILSFRETTDRYLRLSILNQDNPPMQIEGVIVSGFQRRVIFSAGPEASYTLYYGNPQALRPSYDLERLFPFFATEDLSKASLGAETGNQSFVEKDLRPFSERFPWLLPTVLVIAALLVGVLLLKVFQQIRKSLTPQ